MDFALDDVMTLLYPERQLILVVRDGDVQVRRAKPGDVDSKRTWEFVPPIFVGGGGAVSAGVAAGVTVAVQLWKLRERSDKAELPYLVVTDSQARNLRFPYGHPRRNIVYAADPGVGGKYYPVASFHRELFDAKVSEAIRLLSGLAATEMAVEYRKGFDRGSVIDFLAAPPEGAGVEIGGGGKATSKVSSGAKIAMKLVPTRPAHVPKDLSWFPSERIWQTLAETRLESGLRTFDIELRYTDDFGIDGNLKAKIARVGLEVGGSFTEYRETVWKLSGTFAEQLPPDAASG